MVLAAAVCCSPPPAPEPPELVDWSGKDGAPVPLDQPLRLEFAAPLGAPVRAGALRLLDAEGRPAPGLRLEAAGRFLTLTPSLPTRPDLQDGSLLPGREYRLVLHGAPRMDALQTIDGGVLVGDREIRLRTLAAEDGGALLGFGAGFQAVRVRGLRPGEPWQLTGPQSEPVLGLSAGIDPRTLAPAVLLGPGGRELRRCPLRLRENQLDGALLEIDFGDWQGWGMLVLPEGLEGLGGTPLAEAHRAIRVHRAP